MSRGCVTQASCGGGLACSLNVVGSTRSARLPCSSGLYVGARGKRLNTPNRFGSVSCSIQAPGDEDLDCTGDPALLGTDSAQSIPPDGKWARPVIACVSEFVCVGRKSSKRHGKRTWRPERVMVVATMGSGGGSSSSGGGCPMPAGGDRGRGYMRGLSHVGGKYNSLQTHLIFIFLLHIILCGPHAFPSTLCVRTPPALPGSARRDP